MSQTLQPDALPAPVRWRLCHLKAVRLGRDRLLVIGEISFVGGWSLMWATSLGIVPHVSTCVWLIMMGLGLLLASNSRTRGSN